MATIHPTASEPPALPVSHSRAEAPRPGAGRRRPGETMRRTNSAGAANSRMVEASRNGRPMVPGVIRAKRVEAEGAGVADWGSTPHTSMILSGTLGGCGGSRSPFDSEQGQCRVRPPARSIPFHAAGRVPFGGSNLSGHGPRGFLMGPRGLTFLHDASRP